MEAPERARSMAARAARPTSFLSCHRTSMRAPPVGVTFWFQIFIQAPSPEIWQWGGLFWATSFGKNYRRRDRDRLVPPRWMDAAVYRAEVCYPFGGKHGRHQAVKRRDFIALIGAAAAWPLAARAQPADRVRRIGVLVPGSETDQNTQARFAAFRQRLQELGWTEGRNVRF